MPRPISPIVRFRLALRFRKNGHDHATAAKMATQAIEFIESAGLEVVMPGWVPVIDEEITVGKHDPWLDLVKNANKLADELDERKPWRPYDA